MHRIQSRTYVGQPGETVTVSTVVSGGGQARVTVGGQPIAGGQFQLPSTAGATVRMQVALTGPQGASCVVTITVVDGSADTDFLLCSTFNPAPVNFYDFSVAANAAVSAFAAARRAPVSPAPAAAAPTAPAARPRRKTSRKRGK